MPYIVPEVFHLLLTLAMTSTIHSLLLLPTKNHFPYTLNIYIYISTCVDKPVSKVHNGLLPIFIFLYVSVQPVYTPSISHVQIS